MQSHVLICTLFLLLIEVNIVTSTHDDEDNTLIQATPESEVDEDVAPACTQSVDIQSRSTASPDTVSRRTMSGTELIRGSLPVSAPSGVSRLVANAIKNFFVHPDALRNKRFKRQNIFKAFFFRPPSVLKRYLDGDTESPQSSSTTVTTTMSTTSTTTVVPPSSTTPSTPMTTERTTKRHFNRVNNINVIIEATTMASEESTPIDLPQSNSSAVISISTLTIIMLLLTFTF